MEKLEPKLECEHLVPEIKNEIVEDEPIMPNITENGPEIYIKPEGGCDENENSPSCSRDSTSSSRRKRRLDEVDCNIDIDHIYCPKIPKIFKNKSERYRSGNNYECPDCPFITNKRQNFAKHVKNHTTKNGKKCAHCSFRSTKSGIMSHELIHEKRITNNGRKTHMEHFQLEHNISISKMNQSIRVNPILDKDFIVNNGVIKNESTLETDLMQIKSETAENCVIDTKIPRKFNESVNRISSKKNGYRIIMDTNGNRWLKCLAEDCPYKTKMLSSLKAHRIFHKHKGSLKCQYCSFQCKAQVELTWHLLQHVEQQNDKGNVKPDRTFCKVDKVEHDTVGKKSHKKSVMQKRYLNSSLKYHKKSRQYYYQCPDCPFKNKKPTNFSKHFVKHKKTSGKKCFYCTFRGTELEVKEHKLIHKQQISKCDLCNIKFRKRLGFERHRVLKHAISKSEHSHCIDTNDVIDKNNKHNTEDDIIAVILKEESSKSCRNHDLEDERSLLVLTNARRESISQSNENCDKESDGIKAVLLKKDSCNFYNDNKEIVNESLGHSIKNSKEPCDDDTENENINNQTITITITTSSNVNGSDLIKQALVDEILKTFQVSKVQELSGESQHSSNDETIVVSDILKSSVIAKEQDGSDGPNVDCLDQVNTQKSFKSYIEGMVVEIAAHHENGDREGESDNIPNHINENVVMEIAADHENEDRGGESDNIPNHINEDVVIETVADHENGDSGGGSDNIPNHINENVVMEIAADHENGDRVGGSDNHINKDVVIEIVADHENGDSGGGSDNIPNHINENVVIEIAADHENGDGGGGSHNIPNHINEDMVIEIVADHENGDSGGGSDNILNHINEDVIIEIVADHENADSGGGSDNILNHINEDVIIEIAADHENVDQEGESDNVLNHNKDENNQDANEDGVIIKQAFDILNSLDQGKDLGDASNVHFNSDFLNTLTSLGEKNMEPCHSVNDEFERSLNEKIVEENIYISENQSVLDNNQNAQTSLDQCLSNGKKCDNEESSDNSTHISSLDNSNASSKSKYIKCVDLNCAFKTEQLHDLRKHLKYHRRKGVFKCGHCTFSSPVRLIMSIHMQEHFEASKSTCKKDRELNAKGSDKDLNGKSLEGNIGNNENESNLEDNSTSVLPKGSSIKCIDVDCPFRTNHMWSLKNHMSYHRHEGPFKCRRCTFNSTLRTTLVKHMRQHLDIPNLLYKKDSSNNNLNAEILEVSTDNWDNISAVTLKVSDSAIPNCSKYFKCIDADCPYMTNNVVNLKSHSIYHREKAALKCQHCTFSVTSQANMSRHLRAHIRALKSLHKDQEPGNSNDKDNSNILEPSSGNENKSATDNLNASYLDLPTSSADVKCLDADCPYKTKDKSRLKTHMTCHHQKGTFKCLHCTFSGSHRTSLVKHMKAHNDAIKSVRKGSKDPYDYNDIDLHGNTLEDSTDNNENNTSVTSKNRVVFECFDAKCPYKTRDKLCLKRHLQLHRQEGSFMCQYCTFRAENRIAMTKHMQLHSAFPDDLESYYTTIKQKSEQLKSTKSFVARTESGPKNNATSVPEDPFESWIFQCTYCPTKFPEEYLLKGHIKLHSSTKGIRCPICTYRHSKTEIIKHLSWHVASGKGPFTCPICDLNKRTKESMHDHLKVVHSEAIYRKHDSVCKSKVCNGICRKQGAE